MPEIPLDDEPGDREPMGIAHWDLLDGCSSGGARGRPICVELTGLSMPGMRIGNAISSSPMIEPLATAEDGDAHKDDGCDHTPEEARPAHMVGRTGDAALLRSSRPTPSQAALAMRRR